MPFMKFIKKTRKATMQFEMWLKKQKDRDDPIGDLSKDFISSKQKSPFTFNSLPYYACEDAKAAYRDAFKEYIKFYTTFLKNKYFKGN